MHQVLVDEIQQGGLIPGRPRLFPTGHAIPPPAPLACELEGLDVVAVLREVHDVDRPRAPRLPARDRLVLEGLDKLLMAYALRGGHG